MKIKITLSLILLLSVIAVNSQDLELETFNSKSSIKNWKIKTDFEIIHSNHYTFNGITKYKGEKDSFLIFKTKATIPCHEVKVSRKFKMHKSESLSIYFSLLSMDTSNDFLTHGFRINDKTGKNLFQLDYFLYSAHSYPYIIYGESVYLKHLTDTFWQKADSLEVYFRFYPNDPSADYERLVILDGVKLAGVTGSIHTLRQVEFAVYPNPSHKKIHLSFGPLYQPKRICIFNTYGVKVFERTEVQTLSEDINVENLSEGIYYIKTWFENDLMGVKKLYLRKPPD